MIKTQTKKIKRDLLVFLYIIAAIFLLFDVLTINKTANGLVGDVAVTSIENNFAGPTPGTGGSLPTGTPQYYVVVAYNGSPTPTPLVKSAPAKCPIAAGQNSCTVAWPCVAKASTYRVFYGTTASALSDGASASYLSTNSPTTSVAHTSNNGTAGTVPSGSLPLTNFTGSGDLWSLACRMGFGVAAPTAPVEINGNVRMDGTSSIKNSANPVANSDGATRYYVENSADLGRGCPGPTTAP